MQHQDYDIDYDHNELFLHGWLDPSEEYGIDFTTANIFIKNLRTLELKKSNNTILIHMCTCGGDWNYGIAIYDAIKACKKKTVVVAYGHARSMSSIIPQAADMRVIMPNTIFMIHEGGVTFDGSYKSMISHSEILQHEGEVMLDIYTGKCANGKKFKGWELKKIRRFLQAKMDARQEWYLTAREAVEYGFMDAVLGDEFYESIDVLKNGSNNRRGNPRRSR